MALTINLYKFRKRENSTKRPDHGADGVYPCTGTFNKPCGVLNPEINIRLDSNDNPSGFNYMYISDFNRYYWITEWTNVRGLWYCNATVDPLASWREEIADAEEYILRCSSESNGAVLDTLYPIKAGQTQTLTQSEDWPWTTVVGQGCYIVGIINGDTQGTGAVSYYVFTRAALQALQQALFENADWITDDWVDIKEDVFKAIFNPYQYLTTVMYFPFELAGVTPVVSVPFGWWRLNTATPCWHLIPLEYIEHTFSMPVPKHPQAAARGKYLNLEPYTRYALDIWPWGRIHLDSTTLVDCASLKGKIRTDLVTGQATLFLASHFVPPDGGANIEVRTAQVGTPIQLAQSSRDWLQGAANAFSAVSDTADSITGGAVKVAKRALSGGVAGAAGANVSALADVGASVTSGISSVAKAIAPMLETGGTNGSKACLGIKPRLFAEFNYVVDDDNDNRGRPLMERRRIRDIPGYILCADADISIAGTAVENAAIKQYMASGFFFE